MVITRSKAFPRRTQSKFGSSLLLTIQIEYVKNEQQADLMEISIPLRPQISDKFMRLLENDDIFKRKLYFQRNCSL